MMKEIGRRIREIIAITGLSVNQFALRTKNKQKNISNAVLEKNFPSYEVLFNICTNAPQLKGLENLDIKWLITGKKNETLLMVSEDGSNYSKQQQLDDLKLEITNLRSMLDDKENIIKLQSELLERFKK